MPHYIFEARAAKTIAGPIAGVDEAGRGPLAGPVVAAAVILDRKRIPKGLNDSKQMTAEAREEAFAKIMACAIVGVGDATVDEIDLVNIRQATHLAMARAVRALAARAGVCAGRRERCARPALPLRHDHRRRCALGVDRGCFDHRQGDARPDHAVAARRAPRLRLGEQQGLRDRRTSRSAEPPGTVPASPPEFCTGLPDVVSCGFQGLNFNSLIQHDS